MQFRKDLPHLEHGNLNDLTIVKTDQVPGVVLLKIDLQPQFHDHVVLLSKFNFEILFKIVEEDFLRK